MLLRVKIKLMLCSFFSSLVGYCFGDSPQNAYVLQRSSAWTKGRRSARWLAGALSEV